MPNAGMPNGGPEMPNAGMPNMVTGMPNVGLRGKPGMPNGGRRGSSLYAAYTAAVDLTFAKKLTSFEG